MPKHTPRSGLRPRDPSLRYFREGSYVHYPGTGPMAKKKDLTPPKGTPGIREAMHQAGACNCLRTRPLQWSLTCGRQKNKKSKKMPTPPKPKRSYRTAEADRRARETRAARKQARTAPGMSSPPSGGAYKGHNLDEDDDDKEGKLMQRTRAELSPASKKSVVYN